LARAKDICIICIKERVCRAARGKEYAFKVWHGIKVLSNPLKHNAEKGGAEWAALLHALGGAKGGGADSAIAPNKILRASIEVLHSSQKATRDPFLH
jgi:hypothetical protein